MNGHADHLQTFYEAEESQRGAYFFHGVFDFGDVDRGAMFARRKAGETRAYGFAALTAGGQLEVQNYDGAPKRSNPHLLRGGTAWPLKKVM